MAGELNHSLILSLNEKLYYDEMIVRILRCLYSPHGRCRCMIGGIARAVLVTKDDTPSEHWSEKPNNRAPVQWCRAKLRALSDDCPQGEPARVPVQIVILGFVERTVARVGHVWKEFTIPELRQS